MSRPLNLGHPAPAPASRALLLAFALFLSLVPATRAANPFITSIYTADPSAHVWADGRLYVYPSRDIDPPQGCDLMDRYHAYSTEDMVTWRDEGELLRANQIDWGRPEGGFMWAPDCAYKDGMYYFYFPHPSGTDWNNTWKIGVAKSTKPTSGFVPSGYITNVGGFSLIDPCAFIDTDGQAYLYIGGGGTALGGKLKTNMIEIQGSMSNMTGLVDFHEAPWVFKRNGLYYFTYADNFSYSNRLRYATSTNPLGPWTHKGVYLDPTGCDTSHGSIVEYKGQWYQFYHNQSVSGQGTIRSICVDLLSFDTNGNIFKVVQTTNGVLSIGAPPPTNFNTLKYEAENAAISNCTVVNDGGASAGKCLQNLHLTGSYAQFNAINGGSNGGLATLTIRYAANEKSKLRVTVNGVDYSYMNTLASGGWSAFTGSSWQTIPLHPGPTNVIRLAGGSGGVNVDYITIAPLSVPWNAKVSHDASFGIRSNRFGFNITGASETVIIDVATNLQSPTWTPIATNILTGGQSYFSDSTWTNFPGRYYRLKSP